MSVATDQPPFPPIGLVRRRPRDAFFRRAAAALSIFCALLIWTLALRAPFWSVEGSDDAFFAEVADLWTRGAIPYLSAFDIKPPGYFAILAFAEALFGPNLATLKSVSAGFDAVAATALYFIGRRIGSKAVASFAALLYPLLSQIVTNNAPYAPLAAFTTLAFLAALSPLPIVKRAVLAGLAIGAAITIKQTAAFEGLALLAILLRAPDAAPRRLRAGLAFAAAGAIAPFGFLLYFAAHGAAGIMLDDVVLSALRRPASAIENISLAEGVARFLVFLVRPIAPIFALGCLCLLRRRAISQAAHSPAIEGVGWWAAAAVVSVWAQHSLFRAYLGPTLAPLLLLAGACAVFALPELKGVSAPIRLGLLGVVAAAAALFNWGAGLDAKQETRAIGVAAEAIQATHPSPDDRLFVVNRSPWLNIASGLAPPTAYFHWEHTLCDFPGAGPARLAEALAAAPRYIVVADRSRDAKYELPESWRQVDTALARSYRLLIHAQGDADSYDVYLRIPNK